MSENTSNNVTPPKQQLDRDDSAYPQRLLAKLSSKAPTVLHVQGNVGLLNANGIGFCGSRDPDPRVLEMVKDCAKRSVDARFTVISGNAAGIDTAAHFHALDNGGSTILVIPEGINRFRVRRTLKPVWDWNRVLVVSQFEPDHAWKVFRAMDRNQTLVGLSKALLVFEAKEKGGTMNAGQEALKRKTPLYVADYKDMPAEACGNQILLERGGTPFRGGSTIQNIFADVKNASTAPPPQMSLLHS